MSLLKDWDSKNRTEIKGVEKIVRYQEKETRLANTTCFKFKNGGFLNSRWYLTSRKTTM